MRAFDAVGDRRKGIQLRLHSDNGTIRICRSSLMFAGAVQFRSTLMAVE